MIIASLILVISACQSITPGSVKSTALQHTLTSDDAASSMFSDAVEKLQHRQYDAAIDILESLVEKEKTLVAPYTNLGMAYSRTNQPKRAELNFSKALRIDPGHAVANNELGLLYRRTGRFDAAKTAYLNAIARHPDYIPARKNLGILCEIYLHDLDCALEQYQAFLKHAPGDETVANWARELRQRID